MTATVFDATSCILGEGPLWHPVRDQLFWFDIRAKRLYARAGAATCYWGFDEHVSAAGWVDHNRLLLASETSLSIFDLVTGARTRMASLEAEEPATRSNDGRADPWGGFWIGTMGKMSEPGAGAIYRYYRGRVELLYSSVTISNGICFSPDFRHAYFADTATQRVMRQSLERSEGWPDGPPELFLDLSAEDLNPDGAVVDASGRMWLAQWGAGRVACYDAEGAFVGEAKVPVTKASCPAFGGPDLSTLYVTTASVGLSSAQRADEPMAGQTFAILNQAKGQREHQVIL
ncbi:MAG: SMP-30/gluconolactonase/LRE family protein [Pseudomonadota bacterium]